MSVLDELAVCCRRRSWRLRLTVGIDPNRNAQLATLEIRDRDGELLASAPASARSLDDAALRCAAALRRQGLEAR